MWWILFQKVELKWCWLTITYTTWDNRNNLWLCCSLSSSEDDVEEHAKDSKDNARGGQDGVADEEGLVDFSKHLYWCAIGGDTTLREFKWQREGGEQEGKEGNKKGRRGTRREGGRGENEEGKRKVEVRLGVTSLYCPKKWPWVLVLKN